MRKLGGAARILIPLAVILGLSFGGSLLGRIGVEVPGEKSFELESIDVHAALRRDGVLLVREEVTYDFTGEFSVGTRDFDSGPWQIRRIRAFDEDGVRLREITETPTLYEWDIYPATGRRTFELRYEVHRAVLEWPDVVELNWQWVGTTSPGVAHHDLTLRVPGDGEGVRAWAHGPLNGTIGVDGRTITTEVEDLPAATFLETRVVVPANRFAGDLPRGREGQTEPRDYLTECDLFESALRADGGLGPAQVDQLVRDYPLCQSRARVETDPQLPRIIEEETALAEEANAERAAFERQQQKEEDRRKGLTAGAPFIIGGCLLGAWLVWRKWGKEPDLAAEIDYWREVPDDPPAVAVALLRWGAVDTTAFSATVVDLAQRGFLTIAETDKDHTFTATDQSRDGLLEFERMALTKLFENGPQTSQKQLTNWAKAHRTSAASWLNSFTGAVTKAYEAKGYQVKGQAAGWLLYLGLIGILGIFTWLAISYEAYAAAGGAIGAGLVLLATMVLLRRRTPAGAQRHAEWEGLRRFLKDFSQLEDAPVGHMELYERYLVAAVALDVADELIEGLEVRFPQVAQDPTFATWYVGSRVGHRGGGFTTLGDFGSGFASATASSFRPPSSSGSSGGGFGGGFSGGGGGGGGGGGFGAR